MKKSNLFEFTLVLSGVHENTPGLEDELFEAGCDDALINFRNGRVYLDFSREGNSFESVILSAIKDVESSKTEALVIQVAPENYVSEAEIAKRLEVSRQIASLWIKGERRRKGSPFPNPVMKLAEKSPLWKWSEVCQWLFSSKIIKDNSVVERAIFIENINATLEDRIHKNEIRRLSKKLAA